MTAIRPRRSALYMPGSNARALEKAKSLPSDAVILDLEDAVAPDAKEAARAQVCAAALAGGFGSREVVIRINALTTPWGEDDLAAAADARPDAILVPKVSSPDMLAMVGRRLAAQKADQQIRVWAMIETPAAILNIRDIADAADDAITRLSCFVMGTNDLAKETRARFTHNRDATAGQCQHLRRKCSQRLEQSKHILRHVVDVIVQQSLSGHASTYRRFIDPLPAGQMHARHSMQWHGAQQRIGSAAEVERIGVEVM